MTLPDDMGKLKNNVAKFCETWWTSNLDGRESLAANTLVYLFHRALHDKGTVSIVDGNSKLVLTCGLFIDV